MCARRGAPSASIALPPHGAAILTRARRRPERGRSACLIGKKAATGPKSKAYAAGGCRTPRERGNAARITTCSTVLDDMRVHDALAPEDCAAYVRTLVEPYTRPTRPFGTCAAVDRRKRRRSGIGAIPRE